MSRDTTSGTPWLLRAKVSTLRVLWEVPTWPQAGGARALEATSVSSGVRGRPDHLEDTTFESSPHLAGTQEAEVIRHVPLMPRPCTTRSSTPVAWCTPSCPSCLSPRKPPNTNLVNQCVKRA